MSRGVMRILQVVGSMNRAGTETWLVQVLRHLDRDRYHVDFLVHGAGPYDYQEEVEALGARVIACPLDKNLWRYSRRFLQVLRDDGPYDCVHAHLHYFSGIPLALAARAGVPLRIVHSHIDAGVSGRAGAARRLYEWTTRRAIWRLATRGIAVSGRAGDCLFPPRWRDDERWSVMPLGIDVEPFAQPVMPEKVRQGFDLAANTYVVGHVGRFVEEKNHAFVLEIARELAALAPESRFLLVGDGPLRGETEAAARALGVSGHVVFAGLRRDVPRLMRGAMDVFLFPSRSEGFGLAVLEAQAAALPCVISDRVPDEADAGLGLVTRMSIDDPPAAWARTLLRARASNGGRARGAVRAGVKSIEDSARQLAGVYDGARA